MSGCAVLASCAGGLLSPPVFVRARRASLTTASGGNHFTQKLHTFDHILRSLLTGG